MLDRAEVILAYKRLAQEKQRADPSVDRLIEQLPPYLCYQLLRGGEWDSISSNGCDAWTGMNDFKPAVWQGLVLSERGIESGLLCQLQLNGHGPIGAPGIFRWLTLALEELAAKDPERFSYIQTWTSLVVWLLRDLHFPSEKQLTSVSIPIFPHCTFVTEKALVHIPPKTIVPAVTLYALQENLFHGGRSPATFSDANVQRYSCEQLELLSLN